MASVETAKFLLYFAPAPSAPSVVEAKDVVAELRSTGYVLISCAQMEEGRWTKAISEALKPIGNQITVFSKRPLWREIGVDLNRPPDRSEGVGESSLHMDFVNAQFPPDYVCLLCLRPDPLGGGQSTLAPIDAAMSALSHKDQNILRRPIYRDGRVVDLENIGIDINPFAVFAPASSFKYRFTTRLVHAPLAADEINALRNLLQHLESRRIVHKLEAGYAVIVDQHRYVHGKLPLGSCQERLLEGQRRLLLHGFFKAV